MKFCGVVLFSLLSASLAFAAPAKSHKTSAVKIGANHWTLQSADVCPVDYHVPSLNEWTDLSKNLIGKAHKKDRAQFANGKKTRYFTLDGSENVIAYNPNTAQIKALPLPKKKTAETRCVKKRDLLAEHGVQDGLYFDKRNGRSYPVRVLGSKLWLSQNLSVNVDSKGKLSKSADFKDCYLESAEYCEDFGRYYTWQEAKKACPVGWHLPGDAEWRDYQKNLSNAEWKTIGRGGVHTWDSYGDTSNSGYYWSSSSTSKSTARGWSFTQSSKYVERNDFERSTGMYVRCVADL